VGPESILKNSHRVHELKAAVTAKNASATVDTILVPTQEPGALVDVLTSGV
jgi:hypothetical protein